MSTDQSISMSRQTSWWKGIHGEAHVVKLDPSNFDRLVTHTADRPAFVMFFAQWCGYSVSARMAFAALADKMTYEGNPILIGALDCDESKDIASRFREVRGFPTFMFFSKGHPNKVFQQKRSKEVFYKWLTAAQAELGNGAHNDHPGGTGHSSNSA